VRSALNAEVRVANYDSAEEAAGGARSAGADDWATEELWWRENYARRPYVRADLPFDYYSPAYRYGYESASRHSTRQWSDVEGELERGWSGARGRTQSGWQEVREAVRDAWEHLRGGEHERHRRDPGGTISPDERF
jgi:hypothetical protein